MPVLNGGEGLAEALDSLLNQSFKDFQIIISDNNSEDKTHKICQLYMSKDSRIRYYRQADTLTASANFKFVLFEANTPYFMWAADDDCWAPSFIEKNYHNLLNNRLAVASQSKVVFVKDGVFSNYSGGTYSLVGNSSQNLTSFFSNPSDNSRFYGLFRTEVLKSIFPSKHFHAFDWAVSSATLNIGHHLELNEILMVRSQTPNENYENAVLRDHKALIFRIFPILYMTCYILIKRYIKLDVRVVYRLLRLNIYLHCLFGVYRSEKFSLSVLNGTSKCLKFLDKIFDIK